MRSARAAMLALVVALPTSTAVVTFAGAQDSGTTTSVAEQTTTSPPTPDPLPVPEPCQPLTTCLLDRKVDPELREIVRTDPGRLVDVIILTERGGAPGILALVQAEVAGLTVRTPRTIGDNIVSAVLPAGAIDRLVLQSAVRFVERNVTIRIDDPVPPPTTSTIAAAQPTPVAPVPSVRPVTATAAPFTG